ncbi:MAG: fibronectin type III domain-containing protein [Burkholderiales bacterium]|nr:fibronectin type III domain-containing protein [Burkholderiales bacterium]
MSTPSGYTRLKKIKIVLASAGVISALAFGSAANAAAVKLSAYNADPAKTSVSGISSGGYFAQQIHIAYSATFKTGVAVFAGGPYNCAKNSSSVAQADCMKGSPAPSAATSRSDTLNFASAGTIDPTSNLANTKIYMFSGTADDVVKKSVMDVLYTYYTHATNGLGLSTGNVTYNSTTAAQHAWISPYGPNSCGTKGDPYISNCSIDPEQTFLTQFYGTLNAKNTGTLGGSFIEFDQKEFVPSGKPVDYSLADSGWLYVPANCAAKQVCKVHVAVHGCVQSYSKIGDKFIKKAGLNEWADTNNIIVVYPQTVAAFTGGGMSSANPNGCWDFWGYTNASAVKKAGPQMKFIKDIVDRLNSGFVSASANPAPTGLTKGTVTYNTVPLSWTASSGASGYNVYRSNTSGGPRTKSNASLITGTSHTASGLEPNTTYYFVVKAQDSGGLETVDSNQVNATTPDAPVGSVAGPTLTAGTATDTTVPLTWSTVSGATGYNIYYGTASDGARTKSNTNAITTTSYTVGGLRASTTYYFWGRSLDGSGLAGNEGAVVSKMTSAPAFCALHTSSNYAHGTAGRATQTGCATGHVCAVGSMQDMGLNNTYTNTTLKEAPSGYYVISSDCASVIAVPTGLTVGTITNNSVALSWTAVTGASGYNVYVSTTALGTNETKANGSLVTGTSYTVTGLQSNTKYYFFVTAQDSAGTNSQKSDVKDATTTTTTQAAPTSLSVGTVTASSVALSWTAASGATGYNVYQSDISTASGGVLTKVNGTGITGTSYTVTSLAASTTYYFVAKAYNASNQESPASNEVNATTSAQASVSAPTGLSAGTATDTSLVVSYTASGSSDLAGYNMYYSTVSGGPYTKHNSVPNGATSYTYTGLTSSTTYYFVVRAVNLTGTESANSSQVSGSTLSAKPAQPTNVAVGTGTTDTTVPLTWTASTGPNLNGYNVYTATQTGGAYTKHNSSLVGSGATSYTVDKLQPDSSYFFVVRAQNTSSVESVNSNEVAAKTLPATYCKVWYGHNYGHGTSNPKRGYTTSPCTMGYVCAVGSGTNMGLNSMGVYSYLKEKPKGYYTYSATVVTCP